MPRVEVYNEYRQDSGEQELSKQILNAREHSRRDHRLTIEDGRLVEILTELLGIHRCTGDEELQFRSKTRNILESGVNFEYYEELAGRDAP